MQVLQQGLNPSPEIMVQLNAVQQQQQMAIQLLLKQQQAQALLQVRCLMLYNCAYKII